jgi:hypothetical protein
MSSLQREGEQMTDEIKMCKLKEGAGFFGTLAYVPLDPQPCCKNCERRSTSGWCEKICEGARGTSDYGTLLVSPDFFCKYYEPKKVN